MPLFFAGGVRSLGVVLYELAVLRAPFSEADDGRKWL